MSFSSNKILLNLSLLWLASQACSFAANATWSANPVNGDWNIAANWVPNAVPNGPGDNAIFADSNVTNLSQSGSIEINSVTFAPGANAYQMTLNLSVLRISGEGIVNNSGVVQTFVEAVTDSITSLLLFFNTATAGELTFISNPGGEVTFFDQSSAGSATIVTTGSGIRQGHVTFDGSSTAGTATINTVGFAITLFSESSNAGQAFLTTSEGGSIELDVNSSAAEAVFQCDGAGGIEFTSNATGGDAAFTANGATTSGGGGPFINLSDFAAAGNATFVLTGGGAASAGPAEMTFYENATAGNASLTANGGVSGGEGGAIFFVDHSTGGEAGISLFGNGQLDIGNRAKPGVTIGSLAGDGLVFLGAKTLTIGSNNTSTTFSGVMQDGGINQSTGGTLVKIGTGTFTLSEASLYTGGTTVSDGTLVVSNKSGSGTGTGLVSVNAGTLGGSGVIAGAVTLGTGSGAGAFLAPAHGTKKQATLTIQSGLTFNSDSTYTYTFKAKGRKAKTDKVIANGVTINSGASITVSGQAQGTLTQGLVLTVVSNTSATPISGAFSNLADGAILTVNGNKLQADYQGGDGNDLTLTVVP